MLVDRTLRPNPFQTYRDSKTGRWVTVFPSPLFSSQLPSHQSPKQVQHLIPATKRQEISAQ